MSRIKTELSICPFCGSNPVKIMWEEGVETGECCCPATSPTFECPIESAAYTFEEWRLLTNANGN